MIPPQPPNQGKDLNLEGLTREQIKKIQKSMKKPQFLGLLNEYMIQISDPKNKTQYDQYLKQMQKEGQLPKHMKLVKLKPQFCVRTQIISDRNKKHQMKLFINMCSTQYIQKPSCEPGKTKDGGMGYNWRVPNSLGKIRYDQDKHKNPCQVIDCAFHPDTFLFSNQNSAFQAMIISIALQGTQRQLGQRKQTLSKDYIVLKNLKCKGQNGQPALLPIRYIDGKAYNRGEGPAQQQRNTQGKQTKLQKQLTQQKQKFEQEKNKSKQNQQKKQQQQKQQDLQQNKNKLVQDLQTGRRAPKFTSIYTYVTDYSDFIQGIAIRKTRTLPNSFTVQFKVPRMQNISEAKTLEINDKKIILDVEDKYYIDISFEDMKVKNYPLRHSQAKAKFDKKKKILRVQIPVDIASIPQEQLPQFKEVNQQANNQQQQKVVQNQVWKAKVLQIPSEQTNVQKFLPQQEVQQNSNNKNKKKLVEEIDEDDYVEQVKQKDQEVEKDQIQQKIVKEQEIQQKVFKTSDYYDRVNQNSLLQHNSQAKVDQLNYILKQNPNHVVVMIYMKNYQQNEVQYGFRQEQGQLILVWKHKQLNGIHLRFNQQFLPKLKKIQFSKFVGYFAIVLYKQNKGQNWGQQCLINLLKNNQNKSLKTYEQLIQKIKIQNEQRIKSLKQAENVIKQKEDKMIQNISEQKPEQKQQKNQFQKIDDEIQRKKVQKVNVKTSQKEQTNIFQKMPIQFIKFNAPFIETLN